MSDIQNLPIDRLFPHPDNPRLQLRDDVVDRLAAEIARSGFRPEHAILLVRPHDTGWQIVSGHHRVEAAGRAGLHEVPCWVRDMDDDEAFMQLVLGNTQGELSPLEIGMHALRAVSLAEGGRGKRGGLREYADRAGFGAESLRQWRSAAEVANTAKTSWQYIADRVSHLYEISKAPRKVWPALVAELIRREWTVADAAHYVKTVREFEVPENWAWWLPLDQVIARYLATREFAPTTVARLIAAADQVVDWVTANAPDGDRALAEFQAWLETEGDRAWQPREIAGYLQRLIAAQYVVEGWHQGDWREHLDQLGDGTVALVLTDRATGEHWEREFCTMASQFGLVFTPHQIGRPDQSASAYERGPDGWSSMLLPDVTIWSAPGEHHEIKHKNRTRHGMYGLERYRLDALIRFANTTGQPVYYTIHDWEVAGATGSAERVPNDMRHWWAGDVATLSRGCTKQGEDWTYYGGGMRKMPIWYWSATPRLFKPLGEVWVGAPAPTA